MGYLNMYVYNNIEKSGKPENKAAGYMYGVVYILDDLCI